MRTATLSMLMLCVLAGGSSPSVLAGPPQPAPAPDAQAKHEIPGQRIPRPGLMTAGQPAAEDWSILATQGVTTVINLRPESELPARDERAEVEAAGLQYHNIPMAGTQDLHVEHAKQLWDLLEQAEGPVLLHCGSANRAGALLGLAEYGFGGATPDQALEIARSAGMTSPVLEAQLRRKMGLPQADAAE